MAFIFGGNSGMSYEQLQRQREVAAALAARGPGAPRNIGEGLAAVGNALAVRGMTKRADAEEARMRGELDNTWAKAVGANPGGGNMPTGTRMRSPEPMNEGEAVADDAMATLIKMGLTERGLPEHVADGFVMNAADESGFRTDINEINPLVPGSRGGFGLMQWTGPRRVALEREAQGRGVDPSDLNLQLDTIVAEMYGPEARAGQSILSTKDAPSAAQAIVADYLRPAPENLARRSAEYGAGGGYDIAALAEVAGNPMASPGQRMVAETLLARAFEQPDPMAAIELEKAQLELDALRNPQPAAPTPTDDMREYEFAKTQGYGGTFQDFMLEMRRAGATNVTATAEGGASYSSRGETEYDKGRGATFAKRMEAYDADVAGASGAISTLDAMEGLMADPGFYSGSSGDSILALKRAASALGFDPEGVDSMEAFNSLAKKGALDAMGGSLGAGFSNADRDFVEGQVARLANTPEGNRLIISIQRKIQERRLQIAQMAQDYEQANGRLDNGFDEEVRKFVEANPVFDGGVGGGGDDLTPDERRYLGLE